MTIIVSYVSGQFKMFDKVIAYFRDGDEYVIRFRNDGTDVHIPIINVLYIGEYNDCNS